MSIIKFTSYHLGRIWNEGRGLQQHLPGETEKNHETLQARQPVTGPRYEPGASRITITVLFNALNLNTGQVTRHHVHFGGWKVEKKKRNWIRCDSTRHTYVQWSPMDALCPQVMHTQQKYKATRGRWRHSAGPHAAVQGTRHRICQRHVWYSREGDAVQFRLAGGGLRVNGNVLPHNVRNRTQFQTAQRSWLVSPDVTGRILARRPAILTDVHRGIPQPRQASARYFLSYSIH